MTKSQFFKYLSDGGKIRMIAYHGEAVPDGHPLAGIRYAEKVQNNAIRFNNNSWLYKNDIKATDVTEVAAVGTSKAVSVGWAVYQLINADVRIA